MFSNLCTYGKANSEERLNPRLRNLSSYLKTKKIASSSIPGEASVFCFISLGLGVTVFVTHSSGNLILILNTVYSNIILKKLYHI
jgi:hypothetical protein